MFPSKLFKSSGSTESSAISELFNLSGFTGIPLSPAHGSSMLNSLQRISQNYNQTANPYLLYSLGIGWRNYSAWYVRGDDRKQFMEKALFYLERAFNATKKILDQTPGSRKIIRQGDEKLNILGIAGETGRMFENEKLVRDLNKALFYLEYIYKNTKGYEPALCYLANAYYQKEEYQKSIDIALELNARASRSKDFKDHMPTAPLDIARKSYRALGQKYKKSKEFEKAKECYKKIIDLGNASDNDVKIYNSIKLKNC